MAQNLSGKVALVSGGGTGMGRAIVKALAKEGVKIAFCGRRLPPLEQTLTQVQELGGEAVYFQADVTLQSEVERFVEFALQQYGTLDILVNNAGASSRGQIHEHDIKIWDDTLAVNLRAPFLLSRAVLPILREKHSGAVINIGSEMGIGHFKGGGAYSIAKHALLDMALMMAVENQPFGIRVNTICPGWTYTEMTSGIRQLNPEKTLQPEDIADMVLWLLKLRPNIKINDPIYISPMQDPWEKDRK